MSKLLIIFLAVAGFLISTAPAQAASVAELQHSITAHIDPHSSAAIVMSIAATQPLTGSPTVLAITESVFDVNGREWYHVLLPDRGHTAGGWILASDVLAKSDPYSIEISLASRKLTLSKNGKIYRSWSVVVGKASTPTPTGRYQIMETVSQGKSAETGPYALMTNDYSNVLQHFEGGPGQLALHGTGTLSGVPGQAASHGCIRSPDATIAWLASFLPAGTIVNIGR